jgi:hypothetical protein
VTSNPLIWKVQSVKNAALEQGRTETVLDSNSTKMKLAIVIEGNQNSGKTSTIKHLISQQRGWAVRNMKQGFQAIFLDKQFKSLKLHLYCLPASPSETGKTIGELLPTRRPSAIIVAEQPGGKQYTNTFKFLEENDYTILKYSISEDKNNNPWSKFDNADKGEKLQTRTQQILFDIKDFMRTNNIM